MQMTRTKFSAFSRCSKQIRIKILAIKSCSIEIKCPLFSSDFRWTKGSNQAWSKDLSCLHLEISTWTRKQGLPSSLRDSWDKCRSGILLQGRWGFRQFMYLSKWQDRWCRLTNRSLCRDRSIMLLLRQSCKDQWYSLTIHRFLRLFPNRWLYDR